MTTNDQNARTDEKARERGYILDRARQLREGASAADIAEKHKVMDA